MSIRWAVFLDQARKRGESGIISQHHVRYGTVTTPHPSHVPSPRDPFSARRHRVGRGGEPAPVIRGEGEVPSLLGYPKHIAFASGHQLTLPLLFAFRNGAPPLSPPPWARAGKRDYELRRRGLKKRCGESTRRKYYPCAVRPALHPSAGPLPSASCLRAGGSLALHMVNEATPGVVELRTGQMVGDRDASWTSHQPEPDRWPCRWAPAYVLALAADCPLLSAVVPSTPFVPFPAFGQTPAGGSPSHQRPR